MQLSTNAKSYFLSNTLHEDNKKKQDAIANI